MIQMTNEVIKPRERSLFRRFNRLDKVLISSFLFAHGIGLAIGIGMIKQPYKTNTIESQAPDILTEIQFQDSLLKTLSSPEFQRSVEQVKQKRLQEDIEAAEAAREEAEALLVSAESQVSAAEDRAKQIRLEASLAGATKVGRGEEGEPITLDYEARNGTCNMTEFGYTMTLYPNGKKGVIRTLTNVGTCGESENFSPGTPVAFYGRYPVGEFTRSVSE